MARGVNYLVSASASGAASTSPVRGRLTLLLGRASRKGVGTGSLGRAGYQIRLNSERPSPPSLLLKRGAVLLRTGVGGGTRTPGPELPLRSNPFKPSNGLDLWGMESGHRGEKTV